MAQDIWIKLRQVRWSIILAAAVLLLSVPVSLAATSQQPAGVSQGTGGAPLVTVPPVVDVAAASNAPAQAAGVDYFLKIEGVDGEATDAAHAKWLVIDSFQWGGSKATTAAAGGGSGSGKVNIEDLNFVMRVNKASPTLFLDLVKGVHISKATLAGHRTGSGVGTSGDYLKFTFSDVLITSYQSAPDTEKLSLNFTKIEFEYRPTKADGSLDAAVKACWDVKQNKAC